ncbi:galactofuranose ABC transporter, permease protein YjfF [Propionivibrio dicarboxylicus]|uniref:Simple sugar transport system permease protein n=1 Tax=Propionivibrio dicarboxylicus TaxID=83767 RepID=A0A1G8H0D5_9RHOO|nr:galactofuranose ABC transporter, permease protein YjfF [Propionivibrio dicarboxylicus]SDH99950.1 simple sugar transport system permease protein [Propionivibrio dicarboxylicus]
MKSLQINSKFIPLLITIALFGGLFVAGSVSYRGFFSMQVVLNLLVDNSFLIIVALSQALIIIMGGIDLSCGALIALSSMVVAYSMSHLNFHPALAILAVLGVCSLFGFIQGWLITYQKFQPFISTLCGMFIARGMCFMINQDTVPITDPFFMTMATTRIKLMPGAVISTSVLVALAILAIYIYIAHFTRFGRAVYAIGGNEQSARLMGLPVDRTKVMAYTLSGFTSGLAGIVFCFYMLSAYGLNAMALEMDAIAAAVIGGTLMTGGVGYVIGAVFGVMIEGIMQTLITFQGDLNSWWTRIAIAFLLCVFIVVQRILVLKRESRKVMRPVEFLD